MFGRVMLGLAAALALSVSAQAAEKIVTVKVDGVDIRIPLPEGMCETPPGPYADAAAQTAAADKFNDTILTVFSCDLLAGKTSEITYAIMKRPASTRGQTIARPAVIAEYRKDPAAFKKALNAGANSAEAKEMLDELVPPDTKISTGLTPAGADDDGIYVSGVANVQGAGMPSTVAIGMSITAVKGKMLSWNTYATGDTAGVVGNQLRIAKAATKALVKAN